MAWLPWKKYAARGLFCCLFHIAAVHPLPWLGTEVGRVGGRIARTGSAQRNLYLQGRVEQAQAPREAAVLMPKIFERARRHHTLNKSHIAIRCSTSLRLLYLRLLRCTMTCLPFREGMREKYTWYVSVFVCTLLYFIYTFIYWVDGRAQSARAPLIKP